MKQGLYITTYLLKYKFEVSDISKPFLANIQVGPLKPALMKLCVDS